MNSQAELKEIKPTPEPRMQRGDSLVINAILDKCRLFARWHGALQDQLVLLNSQAMRTETELIPDIWDKLKVLLRDKL